MKAKVEPRDDRQVKLIIEAEPEEWERAKRRAARKLSKHVKIPGFRPGKAPYEIIVRFLGEERVEEEAISALLDDFYPKALKELGIEPYAAGVLEEVTSDAEAPRFELLVPLMPVVNLPDDYLSLRLPYEPPEVTDQEVEEALENLLRQMATLETVERPAQVNDAVYVDLDAYEEGKEDGEPLFVDRNHPILVRDEPYEHEWPFPGFGQNFVGAKAGDEKTIIYTYPEDWDDEDLRGKTVVHKVVVKEVKAALVPELTDEFAQKFGYDSADAFRDYVRQNLKNEKLAQYEEEYLEKVLNALLEKAEIQYPPVAFEEAVAKVKKEIEDDLRLHGFTLEDYLNKVGIPKEEFMKDVEEKARRTLEASLLLDEIGRREEIEVSKDEIERRASSILGFILSGKSKKEQRRLLRNKGFIEELVTEAAHEAYEDGVIAFLIAMAKGEIPAEGAEEAEEESEQAAPEAEEASSSEAAAQEPQPSAASTEKPSKEQEAKPVSQTLTSQDESPEPETQAEQATETE